MNECIKMKGAEGVGGARQSQMPRKCPETGLEIFHWIQQWTDQRWLPQGSSMREA